MKRGNKKGQMFLLAAVVICAIIWTLGDSYIKATIKDEPDELSDYTYTVKKETGSVIDYEVYSGFSDGADVSDFVELLAKDFRSRDSTLNFLFIYGNSESMTIKNYGTKTVTAGDDSIPGGGFSIESEIMDKDFKIIVPNTYDKYENNWSKVYDFATEPEVINININNYQFNFTPSKYDQVIFIIQKEANNETYVQIK